LLFNSELLILNKNGIRSFSMKRLLLALALITSTTAFAQHGYWRHDGRGGWGWVAPVVVGGVIGYEIARPAPAVVVQQQPPVVVQQQENCSPWTQIQNPDGTVTTTRTCR
jgi:hypothetical protein